MAILALDLLKKPNILTIKPIYVVMGEDAFLRAESIVAIEKLTFAEDSERMGLTKKSGDSAILADVLDELATQSFFPPSAWSPLILLTHSSQSIGPSLKNMHRGLVRAVF